LHYFSDEKNEEFSKKVKKQAGIFPAARVLRFFLEREEREEE
jgi:hypothetical protein